MTSDRNSILRRYLVACIVASAVTIIILFAMTQLVAPTGSDPDVEQMLLQLQFQRRPPPDTPSGIRVFELPPKPETRRASDSSLDEERPPKRPEPDEEDDEDVSVTREHVIDWWAEARAVVEDPGDGEFEEWLKSQGYRKWVSVMQGPMPTSGDPTAPSEPGSSGSGYRNVYGELEVPISERCVMQMPSKPFDSSDFATSIPPRIVCRETSRIDLSALDEYLDKSRRQ